MLKGVCGGTLTRPEGLAVERPRLLEEAQALESKQRFFKCVRSLGTVLQGFS